MVRTNHPNYNKNKTPFYPGRPPNMVPSRPIQLSDAINPSSNQVVRQTGGFGLLGVPRPLISARRRGEVLLFNSPMNIFDVTKLKLNS